MESSDSATDPEPERAASVRQGSPVRYAIREESHLEVNADVATYTRYLDAHHEWFVRCTAPMEVSALDADTYVITVGRFGAFGYSVEPKIGLRLLAEDQGVYWTRSVPVPGHVHPSYDVDFRSAMELIERPAREGGSVTTRVKWTLNLAVEVWFQRFVRILPEKLLQSTGDRMLGRIVRQVSKRFTEKALLDFHETTNRPIPEQAVDWREAEDGLS